LPLRHAALAMAMLTLLGCRPIREPPPLAIFAGLPISGNLKDAHRAGFTSCFNTDAISVRCRRHGVMILGFGPYEAAVDLDGGDGEGGFDELTIWHDRDRHAVFTVTESLKKRGWKFCYTGQDDRGDQMIMTHDGVDARVSTDLSYYSKRRLRILPASNKSGGRCRPYAG
jgi:hypothetical protein